MVNRGNPSNTPPSVEAGSSTSYTFVQEDPYTTYREPDHDINSESTTSRNAGSTEGDNDDDEQREFATHATFISGQPNTNNQHTPIHTVNFTQRIVRTPDDMPRAGTKTAPKKFKGEYDFIETFLRDYEKLCYAYNATTDSDKCERLFDYVDKKVKQLIEGRPSYARRNWQELKAELLRLYDAERDKTRYTIKDLRKVKRRWKKKGIRNLETWKKYQREFLTVSGWMIQKERLTRRDEAITFWRGIDSDL